MVGGLRDVVGGEGFKKGEVLGGVVGGRWRNGDVRRTKGHGSIQEECCEGWWIAGREA